jgi:hypothetical protein
MHILKIDTYENRKICCQIFESGSSSVILIIASAMGVNNHFIKDFRNLPKQMGFL